MAISTFAVGQPLLDLLGNNPEFFVGRNASRGQIILVGLVTLLVPGITAWAGVQATRALRIPAVTRASQIMAFGTFAWLFFLRAVKLETALSGAGMLAVAAVPAIALTVAYARFETTRTIVRVASAGAFLFAGVFFLSSPSASLLDEVSLGASGATIGNPEDVVVLLADEFPLAALMHDGEIDARHFPNFARLADNATWFDDATAPDGYTPYSIPAIMSGARVSERQTPPVASQYPETIFTLLHPAYDANVHEVVTRLCPQLVCAETAKPAPESGDLLLDVVDLYLDAVSWSDSDSAPGDELVQAATEDLAAENEPTGSNVNLPPSSEGRSQALGTFLDSLDEPADGPRLDYLHLLIPHTPFTTLHDGHLYEKVRIAGANGSHWNPQEHVRHYFMLQLYEQARFVDSMVGALIQRLEELGRWEDTNFIFVSDHGMSFNEGSRLFGDDGEPTLVFVPFFFKAAGQTEGQRLSLNAGAIDLLPTLAGQLEIEIPWEVEGRDLLDDGAEGRSSERRWGTLDRLATFDSDQFIDAAHSGLLNRMGADPDGPGGYFAIGPRRDLIGTSLPDDLPTSSLRAAIQALDAIEGGVTDDRAEAAVVGTLEGSFETSPGAVVVALDDTILATSPIYDVDGRWYFATLIDPDRLPRAPADLRVAVIDDDGFRSISLVDG